MRIQPRQHLLETWKATVNASLDSSRNWMWGGATERNSISDAEQLLCIMYPSFELPGFSLHAPDRTSDDVLGALAKAGDNFELPLLLLRVIGDYLQHYRTEAGRPTFSGGSYFISIDPDGTDLKPDQRALDVVDAYSMSITLMLNVLSFLRGFRPFVRREKLLKELNDYEGLANERLTAAMVGLMRSFAVNSFNPDDEAGRILRRNISQGGLADRQAIDVLQAELAPVRASLSREVLIGSGSAETLDNDNLLFECGWTWGVADDAPPSVLGEAGTQEQGIAPQRPYLYFTGVALDGLEDVFSDRTRIRGLLNEQQQRLAQALLLRYQLTRTYWSTMAMFGRERWPVEDIPWTTSDSQASDYYSLLVASMAVQDLVLKRGTDVDLRRIYQILSDLASRGRITRRITPGDEASIALHSPGVSLTLEGSDRLGPRMGWQATNFAALLLKRTVSVAELAQTTELRNQLLDLAGAIWDHLLKRRLTVGPARDLWDRTDVVFPIEGLATATEPDRPSWYFTERVVECMVAAASVVSRPPLRSPNLSDYAADLLNEAEHLYDRELLGGAYESSGPLRESLNRARLSLERARSIVHERPGSAVSLATEILRELDNLAAARSDSG